MSQSYYELLGVPSDASTEAVEAAYRERAKETHPDRSDAPDAVEQFKAISRARDVLADPQERARYDRLGHEAYVGDGPVHSHPSPGTRAGPTGTTPGDWDGAQSRQQRRTSQRRRDRRQRERSGRNSASQGDDGARADGFGEGFDDAWWRDENGESFGRRHAAENRSRSWYRPGADGNDGYRVSTRDDHSVRFTTERIGIAVVTFALYPVFVASAFVPAFPLAANLLVGLCTLALVVYLLSVPETGVLVFGGWTLLAPFALTATGIELLSGLGVLAWAFCWVPFVLAVANLLFRRA